MRSQWGSTRQLPSGLWQARARDGSGSSVSVGTFRTKREAERALQVARNAQERAEWVQPSAGRITLAEWCSEWAPSTAHLAPRTRELYAYLLAELITPGLGRTTLAGLDVTKVEVWLSGLRASPRFGPATVAKAYRLLRQIMSAAVRARRIGTNPCIIRGAGQEPRAQVNPPTLRQVLELADEIDPRWRAMVLLAGSAGLRWGECAGLRWEKVDLLRGRVKIDAQLVELQSGEITFRPPKTEAGVRWVALPGLAAEALADHLRQWPGRPGDLVFRSPLGMPLRRSMWTRRVWHPARAALGLEGVRFHDLRHCALTAAAQEGATLAELMAQAGHSSTAAAVRYQHATEARAREVADRVSKSMRRAGTS